MRAITMALLSLGLLGLTACGEGADPMDGEDQGATVDPSCSAPTDGFGTQINSNLIPLDLATTCDGTPFDLYSQDSGFCESTVTVLIRAAGWCVPCQAEAEEIGQGLLDEYADRGVRVISVMDQSERFDAPTQADCEGWQAEYGLGRPQLGDIMLRDPAQEISVYFPAGENGYPGNVIFDSNGVIRDRIIGFAPGLSTLRASLDAILAEDGN